MTSGQQHTLAVVSAATAVLLLDVTVVNVAIPDIRDDLDAGFAQLQWVIDAYTLTLAATLLTAGVLADRYGRRRIFTAGLAVFTLASLLCGAAPHGTALDLARAVQGVGGAAMFSSSLALLAHEFRGRERAVALTIWGAVTGAALAVGPLVGGLLVDAWSWRLAFLINLPLGLLLMAQARRLPDSRDPAAGRLDLPGMASFALATTLLVVALVRGNDSGWGSPTIVGCLIAAAVVLAAFVVTERRSTSPMLPLELFADPRFTGTAIVAFAQSVALYPLLLFLAIYLQDYLQLTPTEAGLRVLPLTIVLLIVAPLSGRLTERLPLRIPLITGLTLIAVSLLLMSGIDADDDWTGLLPGLLVAGLGVGTISPALATAMVSVLPVDRSGLASGVNNTFRQLGIAVGVAGLGAIFAHHDTDILQGLHDVVLVAAGVAATGAVIAWPLLGGLRSDNAPQPS